MELVLQFVFYRIGALFLGLLFPGIRLRDYARRSSKMGNDAVTEKKIFTTHENGNSYWRQGTVELAGLAITIGLFVVVAMIWPAFAG